MKTLRFISTILGTSAMFLLFCISTPVLRAQDEHQAHDQETKPTEDSAKPAPSKPTKAEPKDEKRPEDSKAPKENAPRDNNRQSQTEGRTETRTQTESKTTAQHGRVENGRIPDADFHAHFGREHHFHVGHPQVVNGESRFQYGGYWFTFGEPWPVGWGYDDDFYVDFIDGQYYLIDLRHPEVRLALVVVL